MVVRLVRINFIIMQIMMIMIIVFNKTMTKISGTRSLSRQAPIKTTS